MKMLINGREYDQVTSGKATLRVLWELRDQTRRLGDPIGSRRLVELERAVEQARAALTAARRAGDEAGVLEAQGRLMDATDELLPATVYVTRRAAGEQGTFLGLIDCDVEFIREPGDDEDDVEGDAAAAGDVADPPGAAPGSPATPGAAPARTRTRKTAAAGSRRTSRTTSSSR